ncbi:hypothetical protein ACLD5R_00005 [Gardnerella leopoldii]|uniref:hypothetical protein n=1 Tax=Gardnerella TaxID=2701 RepID=UPI003970DC06
MPHLRDTLHYEICNYFCAATFAQQQKLEAYFQVGYKLTKVGSLLPSRAQTYESWKSTSKLSAKH